MLAKVCLAVLSVLLPVTALSSAQDQKQSMPGMRMPAPASSPSPSPSPANAAPGSQKAQPSSSPQAQMKMPAKELAPIDTGVPLVMSGDDMAVSVGSSQSNVMFIGQMGSGTSWQPISSPMYMVDKQKDNWLFMLHYNLFVGVNRQGRPRGVAEFGSANWFMPMAFHRIGKGTLELRGMFSFEPFTFSRGGSPLLFQTGETYKGQPLIDRQHPHDLVMELSAQYTLSLGDRGTWYAYFGYPGEPALGPPAFMHRYSASENPSAALSHHLQDSTHVSFGVFTTGFTYRWFKLEGSIFNGREPDENRYNFEAHTWNSRSIRLSLAPNRNWSAQVSYGFLSKPEAAEPTTDIRRTTASVQYTRPFDRGNWASAIIWGRNHQSSPGEIHNLNGYTFESTVNFLNKNYLYTRLELVDKNELLRPADRLKLGINQPHPSFRIGAYTFGGVRDIWHTKKVSLGIGGDFTLYSKPAILAPIYGNHPGSYRIFLRVRPHKMEMGKQPGGVHTH